MTRLAQNEASQVEQIGKLRGILECLVGAIREPENNPVRGAYLNYMLGRADDLLAAGLIAGMDEGTA
jgi:hypothetical protein